MSHPNETGVATEIRLFTGESQYENFPRWKDTMPVSRMDPANEPFEFETGPAIDLPERYDHDGVSKNLQKLLSDTDTSALLVLKDGAVRFERYWLTGGRRVQWISMSVAKSFVSALVGVALGEGLIRSIEEPITTYAPKLIGTAYDGVRIKDVVQMSSGARWSEDYADPDADVLKLIAAARPGNSFDEFMSKTVHETTPGTVSLYDSADTQALAMMILGATGRSLSAYMQEKLYEPLGMESPGYWVTDSQGVEMAFGGLLMTARDFAKLGELYRNGGAWGGRQIVPADYVAASIKVDAPHLAPGRPIVSGHAFPLGYGYQWWLPEGGRGEYSAIGVYNQYVYVDPSRDIVIVKLSANPAYGTSHDDADNKDMENISGLRAICQQFD